MWNFPDPGTKRTSPVALELAGRFLSTEPLEKPRYLLCSQDPYSVLLGLFSLSTVIVEHLLCCVWDKDQEESNPPVGHAEGPESVCLWDAWT